jgi:hypothetical protein
VYPSSLIVSNTFSAGLDSSVMTPDQRSVELEGRMKWQKRIQHWHSARQSHAQPSAKLNCRYIHRKRRHSTVLMSSGRILVANCMIMPQQLASPSRTCLALSTRRLLGSKSGHFVAITAKLLSEEAFDAGRSQPSNIPIYLILLFFQAAHVKKSAYKTLQASYQPSLTYRNSGYSVVFHEF